MDRGLLVIPDKEEVDNMVASAMYNCFFQYAVADPNFKKKATGFLEALCSTFTVKQNEANEVTASTTNGAEAEVATSSSGQIPVRHDGASSSLSIVPRRRAAIIAESKMKESQKYYANMSKVVLGGDMKCRTRRRKHRPYVTERYLAPMMQIHQVKLNDRKWELKYAEWETEERLQLLASDQGQNDSEAGRLQLFASVQIENESQANRFQLLASDQGQNESDADRLQLLAPDQIENESQANRFQLLASDQGQNESEADRLQLLAPSQSENEFEANRFQLLASGQGQTESEAEKALPIDTELMITYESS